MPTRGRPRPCVSMKVTFKGTYQMNGPKPFNRTIECSASEARNFAAYVGNKKLQEKWILANFPGAKIHKGFSCSVNIH